MSFPHSLPEPRLPDPTGGPVLRWGVIGTGWIAERFVASVLRHTNHQVVAVGSRSEEGARRFTGRLGGEPLGSYAELVAHPRVDVVYVASPHPQHVEHALLAIAAGKHVLVEKPIAIDAAGARRIAEAARAAGVFAMEAMWSLCLPKFRVISRLLDDGVLGDLTLVSADIGEYFPDRHRIHDPALAGGAMMDLGTYPLTLATWVLGAPTEVAAQGVRGPTGTMAQTTMTLRHGEAQSALHASALVETPTVAAISGSDAWVSLDGPWYQPGSFTLHGRGGGQLRHLEAATAHDGLFWEALEVAHCLGEGRTESVIRPLDATIATLEAMDQVRAVTDDRLAGES